MGTFLGLAVSINSLLKEEFFKAFRVMNVRVYKLILAEQISCAIHLIIQGLLIITCSSLIFGSELILTDVEIMSALLLHLIFVILASSILGIIAKNKNVLVVLGQLCFFVIIFLGGIMFPASFLPGGLQKAASVLPASVVINIRDGVGDGNLLQLLITVVVILVLYIIAYQVKLNSDVD